jgi:putative transposase
LRRDNLLDEWLVAAWPNRPHDGLRDPTRPGRVFTLNEKYAAMVEAAGYVPVALSAEGCTRAWEDRSCSDSI